MNLFSYEYDGGAFVLFDTAHLLVLGLIVLFNFFLFSFRSASETVKARVRWAMALSLWLNELAYHLWYAYWGIWDLRLMLPLHVCSALVWLGGVALVTKNYRIYEFSYFMGIAGALQALLTPDVGIYGFPHFRAVQTFISHGLIVSTALYLTVVEGFRPTWKSLVRVLVGMNLYMVVIFFINLWLGSNYLFIAHKPATASVLDMLPPWPYYILYIEALGMILTLLLYLPFAISDWRKKGTVAAGG